MTEQEAVKLNNGDEIYDKNTKKTYKVKDKLGAGAYGSVFHVYNIDTNEEYALKAMSVSQINHNKNTFQNLSNEKQQLNRTINFPYIVKYHTLFQDDKNVYFLMEYYPNKSLDSLLKTRNDLTEYEVKYFGYQILLALEYLHSCHIMHRDLKLGNIVLSKHMEVKLCDFGLAVKAQKRNSLCGTPNYMSPEQHDKQSRQLGYGSEVDIWAYGVILYTLFYGKPPFQEKDNAKTEHNIKHNIYHFHQNKKISKELETLIKQIFVIDRDKRIKLPEIKASLFIDYGKNIPKTLPESILKYPPTERIKMELLEEAKRDPYPDQRGVEEVEKEEDEESSSSKSDIESNQSFNNQNGSNEEEEKNDNNNNYKQSNQPPTPKKKVMINEKDEEYYSTPSLKDVNKKENNPFNPLMPLNNNDSDEDNDMTLNNDLIIVNSIDSSNKYGIGYQMSNDNSGVYFNDNTKILFSEAKGRITYIDRDEYKTLHTLKKYEREIEDKIKLFKVFKEALDSNRNKAIESMHCNENDVYVQKWKKTDLASFFLLSNKTIQVIFKDKTSLLFLKAKDKVKYITNSLNQRTWIGYAFNSEQLRNNTEVFKRVQYARKILLTK